MISLFMNYLYLRWICGHTLNVKLIYIMWISGHSLCTTFINAFPVVLILYQCFTHDHLFSSESFTQSTYISVIVTRKRNTFINAYFFLRNSDFFDEKWPVLWGELACHFFFLEVTLCHFNVNMWPLIVHLDNWNTYKPVIVTILGAHYETIPLNENIRPLSHVTCTHLTT